MDEFEEQLHLQKLAEQKPDDRNKIKTRTDADGTVFEWDSERKAWFAQIDDNFLANYQMNYGENKAEETPAIPEAPADINSPEYRDWYYKYYGNVHQKKEVENTSNKDGDEYYKMYCEYLSSDTSKLTDEEKKERDDYWKTYADYYYGQSHQSVNENKSQPSEKQDQQTNPNECNKAGSGENKNGNTQEGTSTEKDKAEKKPLDWFEIDETKNTNVYVNGLPNDMTHEEFEELMKKYGLIMYDPFTHKPKVKLYKDASGANKGDGLCCYIKHESVELALNILDGSDIRGFKIYVERAKFEKKGEFNPQQAKRRKMSSKQKKKLKERQEKLFDWKLEQTQSGRPKNERIIVVKNAFDSKLFESNPAAINDVRDNLRNECANFGQVKKVNIYDRNVEGIATVAFLTPEEADNCVSKINNRIFCNRLLAVSTWDGKTKYDVEETPEEEKKRLKQWDQFLQDGEGKKTGVGKSGTNQVGKNEVTKKESSIEVETTRAGECDKDKVTETESSSKVESTCAKECNKDEVTEMESSSKECNKDEVIEMESSSNVENTHAEESDQDEHLITEKT